MEIFKLKIQVMKFAVGRTNLVDRVNTTISLILAVQQSKNLVAASNQTWPQHMKDCVATSHSLTEHPTAWQEQAVYIHHSLQPGSLDTNKALPN
jgi:hypothetical protein